MTDVTVTEQFCPYCMAHWGVSCAMWYMFFTSWLRRTTFISQPIDGSLWEILNCTTSKDPGHRKQRREQESMPTHRNKRDHGVDSLGILHACGSVVSGTDEKGPSRTLEPDFIQKSVQRGGCCTLKNTTGGRAVADSFRSKPPRTLAILPWRAPERQQRSD